MESIRSSYTQQGVLKSDMKLGGHGIESVGIQNSTIQNDARLREIAGNHMNVYEGYYSVIDPKGLGVVEGIDAARMLKKSGLSDVILSRIWDLSDPGSKGKLDKIGVFVALKLIALVQNGKDLSVKNLDENCAPPKMGDLPLPKVKIPPAPANSTPLISSLPPTAVDWTIKPSEREKYDKLFDSLQPVNGVLPGNKVKSVLMQSKLPVDTLGKIWDLADQDKDGMLNRHEFVVAMHLVYKALEKYVIPNTLPSELMPPPPARKVSVTSFDYSTPPLINQVIDDVKIEPAPINHSPAITPKPVVPVQPTQTPWVVTVEEKSKSDALFIKSDIDKDGLVSGVEIKDVFLRSGVPQQLLAHIWALCDIKQTGKLNNEQFALAMWFIARCLKGIDPPLNLTPEMIPPSFRTVKTGNGVVIENNNRRYSNPELEMISKDIQELCKEISTLQMDIVQKEADIKIKTGEIKNLQNELDTLSATFRQLENQKGEAQKRLNDLRLQCDKLRTQADEQAQLVSSQETELNTKKRQLDGLKQEEHDIKQQIDKNEEKLKDIGVSLQETQLSISQIKASITQLEEQKRQFSDAITAFKEAIDTGDATHVSESILRITPDFRNNEYRKLAYGKTEDDKQNEANNDPFAGKNAFDEDPFKNDPFKPKSGANDPFAKSDAFTSDPFNNSFNQVQTGADPFASFPTDGQKSGNAAKEDDKDQFGCDPFAVLHAPTRDKSAAAVAAAAPAPPRPVSPSPALPPKKSKQPPPRPAPPRPTQPPAMKKAQNTFGSNDPFNDGSDSGFADFSDFDSKFCNSSTITNITPASVLSSQTTLPTKDLDFSDDPFKDYRYEDPFNITFDDDDDENDNVTTVQQLTKTNDKKSSSLGKIDKKNNNMEFGKFDPFNLNGSSSSSNNNNNNNNSTSRPTVSLSASSLSNLTIPTLDNWKSGRLSAPTVTPIVPVTEDQQFAWAARESIRDEEDRKRQQKKEQAELEMVIQLSRKDI